MASRNPDFQEVRLILTRHKVALIHGPDGELSERRAWLNSRETAVVLDALRALLRERKALEEALCLFADVEAWSMRDEDVRRYGRDAGPWYFNPETDDGTETPWDLACAALLAPRNVDQPLRTSEDDS